MGQKGREVRVAQIVLGVQLLWMLMGAKKFLGVKKCMGVAVHMGVKKFMGVTMYMGVTMFMGVTMHMGVTMFVGVTTHMGVDEIDSQKVDSHKGRELPYPNCCCCLNG